MSAGQGTDWAAALDGLLNDVKPGGIISNASAGGVISDDESSSTDSSSSSDDIPEHARGPVKAQTSIAGGNYKRARIDSRFDKKDGGSAAPRHKHKVKTLCWYINPVRTYE